MSASSASSVDYDVWLSMLQTALSSLKEETNEFYSHCPLMRERLTECEGAVAEFEETATTVLPQARRDCESVQRELEQSGSALDRDEILECLPAELRSVLKGNRQEINASEQTTEQCSSAASAKAAEANKENNSTTPVMLPISNEEYSAIPQYMLSRLSLAQLNAIIAAFNSVVSEKCKLLQMARNKAKARTLTKEQKDKIITFKSEFSENASQSDVFCTESQLRQALSAKDVALLRKAIPCLRHCKRLREVRGGGCTRLVRM